MFEGELGPGYSFQVQWANHADPMNWVFAELTPPEVAALSQFYHLLLPWTRRPRPRTRSHRWLIAHSACVIAITSAKINSQTIGLVMSNPFEHFTISRLISYKSQISSNLFKMSSSEHVPLLQIGLACFRRWDWLRCLKLIFIRDMFADLCFVDLR